MLGALVAGVGGSHYDTYFEGNCGHSFQVVTPSLLDKKLWTEVRVGVEEMVEWYLRIPFPRKENTGKSSKLLASMWMND